MCVIFTRWLWVGSTETSNFTRGVSVPTDLAYHTAECFLHSSKDNWSDCTVPSGSRYLSTDMIFTRRFSLPTYNHADTCWQLWIYMSCIYTHIWFFSFFLFSVFWAIKEASKLILVLLEQEFGSVCVCIYIYLFYFLFFLFFLNFFLPLTWKYKQVS
jgi:hypothetical protein